MATERKIGAMQDAQPTVGDSLVKKERFLVKRVNGGVSLCGAGELACGVITEGKAVGGHTSFATGNQLKAIAGAAIAVNDKLASDADGKVVPAAAGQNQIGVAIGSAAENEIVAIEFTITAAPVA